MEERGSRNDRQAAAFRAAYERAQTEGRNTSRPAAIGEPGDLRGIPVVGARGVGGVSPHTQPEMETIRKLMREAA